MAEEKGKETGAEEPKKDKIDILVSSLEFAIKNSVNHGFMDLGKLREIDSAARNELEVLEKNTPAKKGPKTDKPTKYDIFRQRHNTAIMAANCYSNLRNTEKVKPFREKLRTELDKLGGKGILPYSIERVYREILKDAELNIEVTKGNQKKIDNNDYIDIGLADRLLSGEGRDAGETHIATSVPDKESSIVVLMTYDPPSEEVDMLKADEPELIGYPKEKLISLEGVALSAVGVLGNKFAILTHCRRKGKDRLAYLSIDEAANLFIILEGKPVEQAIEKAIGYVNMIKQKHER